ncbi:hypothetical protein [Micromonospora avicenniae]|uniref:hypothetical protein n=1 Tax=Micromonospora avicenniae TaxID=1198245 RepID=UPI003422368C
MSVVGEVVRHLSAPVAAEVTAYPPRWPSKISQISRRAILPHDPSHQRPLISTPGA